MTGTPVRLDLSSPSRGPRGKPPKHFVDLTPEQRIEAVTELGEKIIAPIDRLDSLLLTVPAVYLVLSVLQPA